MARQADRGGRSEMQASIKKTKTIGGHPKKQVGGKKKYRPCDVWCQKGAPGQP